MPEEPEKDEAHLLHTRIETLIAALSDTHVSVVWNAARELAKFGMQASAAVPALESLLSASDATSVLWVRYALTKITGDVQICLPYAIAALGDKQRVFPGMASAALAGLGAAAAPAVPALILELSDQHADNRWAAAGALANIGPAAAEAVPVLTESLIDPDEKVRWYAAWALGEIGPASAPAVSALIDALHDGDDDVRGYAVRALGRIGAAARTAIPELQELQHSANGDGEAEENETVWAEIVNALERLQTADCL